MAPKSLSEVFEEKIPGSSVDSEKFGEMIEALRSPKGPWFSPGKDPTALADFLEERVRESVGKFVVETPQDAPFASVEAAVTDYFARLGFVCEYQHGNGRDEFFRVYRRVPYAFSACATSNIRHGVRETILTLEQYDGPAFPASC